MAAHSQSLLNARIERDMTEDVRTSLTSCIIRFSVSSAMNAFRGFGMLGACVIKKCLCTPLYDSTNYVTLLKERL